jgi:hypothetical protein
MQRATILARKTASVTKKDFGKNWVPSYFTTYVLVYDRPWLRYLGKRIRTLLGSLLLVTEYRTKTKSVRPAMPVSTINISRLGP